MLLLDFCGGRKEGAHCISVHTHEGIRGMQIIVTEQSRARSPEDQVVKSRCGMLPAALDNCDRIVENTSDESTVTPSSRETPSRIYIAVDRAQLFKSSHYVSVYYFFLL